MPKQSPKEMLAYITAFAAGEEGALHAYRLDVPSGRLEFLHKTTEVKNPFFLALSPDYRFLYSIHEPGQYGGGPGGEVAAFALDRPTGKLTFLNRSATGGPASCYLDVDATGRCVLSASYSGGSVAVLPVQADGSLGQATCLVRHEGSSVNPQRQKKPYAHCIVADPTGRFAFAADLGTDKIMIYRLDSAAGKLVPNEQPFVRTPPGGGPRHFTFHPSQRYAYGINEMGNSVTVFRYDKRRGTLFELQTLSTLPTDWQGTSHCADVKVTPSGKFLYGTNRGHDSIAIYAVDKATGLLSLVGIEPSRGKNPQNLAITPDGSLLLVANMGGDNAVVFRIHRRTGKLTETGQEVRLPKPSCIMLVPAAGQP
jgi:6-phosphogluconolactonase